MGEQLIEDVKDIKSETNMNISAVTFDNLRILKEFSDISNLVKNEDFLETVPKLRGVKWVQMFNCLKQNILSEMVQEISSMWDFENMHQKLAVLDKQKEKFAEINPQQTVWRPQHKDVKGQLRAFSVAKLQMEKTALESLVQENEAKVNRLKKTVAAKRGYLKALQMDIQKYQKKNEQIIPKIHEKFLNHGKFIEYMIPNMINIDDICSPELEVDK